MSIKKYFTAYVFLLILITACNSGDRDEVVWIPQIDGEWWQLTTTYPDISPYTYGNGDNKVCDFTIFRAKDSTWQLIACVRGNDYPGSNRFFYRWEANNLTDTLWQETGVFQSTGTDEHSPDGFGTTWNRELYPAMGLLQAPHCIVDNDRYYLFYNNRDAMCKVSDDGKSWTDLLSDTGSPHLFEMGRDVMIFDDREQSGKWIAYYTTGGDFPQFMDARTAENITDSWSEGTTIYDGWSNTRNPIYRNEFAESPFVLRYQGKYYLFAQLHVFISDDPLNFNDNNKIANLESSHYDERVWAPEIITDENGNYYIAAYRPKGLYMAKLRFVRKES